MQPNVVFLFACAATLLATSSAHAGWTWKKADNPNTAGSSGLNLPLGDGKTAVACRVTVGSEQYLGAVVNGACQYKTSATATPQKKNAPDYDYLASDGDPATVMQGTSNDGFVPTGAIRAQVTEQGPVLCGVTSGATVTSVGWVGGMGNCILSGGNATLPDKFVFFITTPTTGLSERPPLWRDLNTTGGTQGMFSAPGSAAFCRASTSASGPKIAPGVFYPGGGGKCVYVESATDSGATFAQTTDKSRFLVLFNPTGNTEQLRLWQWDTRGQMMLGVVGNEKALACALVSKGVSGVFLNGRCALPPNNGAGAATYQVAARSLVTLFRRAY
jgi:hypothetical protein